MKTRQQIKDFITEVMQEEGKIVSVSLFTNGDTFENASYYLSDIIKEVETIGGEGEGEYYAVIYAINFFDGDVVHIRFEGHYDSWNGVDWNYQGEFDIVEAYEKTVTAWRTIKG